MSGMQISVANATGFRLDEDLTSSGRRDVPFLEDQWLPELLDNCDLHLTFHGQLPF
jgi:hypothetical protein